MIIIIVSSSTGEKQNNMTISLKQGPTYLIPTLLATHAHQLICSSYLLLTSQQTQA